MASHKPLVLVVEDDPNIAHVIARALRTGLDAEIRIAHENADAIAILKSDVPQLVTTDLRRAGGDGEDLIDHIRADPRLKSVPIIVLSGVLFLEGAFDHRIFRHRIDGAFQKPLPLGELLQAAARCIGDVDPYVSIVRAGFETKNLDYKLDIDTDDKRARACLAKDVIAFSNSGGGHIVFGVDDSRDGSFTLVGLGPSSLRSLEVTRLNDVIRRYVGHETSVLCRRVDIDQKHFVVVTVEACHGRVAVAREAHSEAGLALGRIYVRNEAAQTVEVQDPTTIVELIDRLVAERTRK